MEHFKWSVEVYFSCFESKYSLNGLYSAPGPFLLTLTTVNVDDDVDRWYMGKSGQRLQDNSGHDIVLLTCQVCTITVETL